MTYDNHDPRIRYFELMLEGSLDEIRPRPLPRGYHISMYRPGDRDAWIAIERSARELESYEQGLEVWDKYYSAREDELPARMAFVETDSGEKVATATAMYDVRGLDTSGDGWLHWVAVARPHQGKGLSKPLITRVLDIMKGLGYTRCKIPTQTTTWLAVKVYLDLGFRPIPKNAERCRDGWRIVKALTGHPALAAFDPAAEDEIMDPNAR